MRGDPEHQPQWRQLRAEDLADRHGPRLARVWRNVQSRHGGDLHGIIDDARDGRSILIAGNKDGPEYIVKFDPRLIGHNILLLEAEAVQEAAIVPDRPEGIAIPGYLSGEDDHLVLSWVPGRTATLDEINYSFSSKEQELFGRDLAGVIVWNSQISLDALEQAIKRRKGDILSDGDWDWRDRYENFPSLRFFNREVRWRHEFLYGRGLDSLTKMGYPQLAEVTETLIMDHEACSYRCMRSRFWGHHDLYEMNLPLVRRDGGWRLGGLIDWGSTAPSCIEREARMAPGRFADRIADAMYETLEGSVEDFDLSHVGMWAFIQAVTAILSLGPLPDFTRPIEYLYPDLDWSELKD